MLQTPSISSKILVFEKGQANLELLKKLFQTYGGLKDIQSTSYREFNDLLAKNLDLGGIFLGDYYEEEKDEMFAVIHLLQLQRPELPIFIRSENPARFDDLGPTIKQNLVFYQQIHESELNELIDKYILNMSYPTPFISGIQDITQEIISSILPIDGKEIQLFCRTPFLIRDRFLESDLFSLIRINSDWCNGYMLTEVIEQNLKKHFNDLPGAGTQLFSLHGVNDVLSEITNMVWGSIKGRFMECEELFSPGNVHIQIPIVVNGNHISFGGIYPQLCFRYVIFDQKQEQPLLELAQRFIFNITWSPQAFQEQLEYSTEIQDTGEVELF